MILTRRDALLASGALALTTAARARGGGKVAAAGPPAAVLIAALAPDRLLGWPHRPSPAARALLGPVGDLPETGALVGHGEEEAALARVAAAKPGLVIDYGDVTPKYLEAAARVGQRLGVPYRLIDGHLARTPQAIREAAALIGVADRGLSDLSADVLAKWRRTRDGTPFFYARSGNGLDTAMPGSTATEVLEGAGWINVATKKRATFADLAAWDPDVVVTHDAGLAADPRWLQRPGRPRRMLLLPSLPFGWIDHPPSLNRLIGCAWLSGGDAFADRVAQRLYRHRGPLDQRARWLD